jgi:hypothetical protein
MTNMPEKLLVFAALAYEAKAIAASMGREPEVELRVIGPGATRLPSPAQSAGCRGIIMAGLGGALDPALQIGDVVIDSEAIAPDGPWRGGHFHTADQIIATPAQKHALFKTTGALVVEMENARARELARTMGVPFLGIRAISDRSDEILDPAIIRMVDSSGRVRAGALAGELLKRPALIASLLRLRPRSACAMKSLCDALELILRMKVI